MSKVLVQKDISALITEGTVMVLQGDNYVMYGKEAKKYKIKRYDDEFDCPAFYSKELIDYHLQDNTGFFKKI